MYKAIPFSFFIQKYNPKNYSKKKKINKKKITLKKTPAWVMSQKESK